MTFDAFADHEFSRTQMREKWPIAHSCCFKINGARKLMGLRYLFRKFYERLKLGKPLKMYAQFLKYC